MYQAAETKMLRKIQEKINSELELKKKIQLDAYSYLKEWKE